MTEPEPAGPEGLSIEEMAMAALLEHFTKLGAALHARHMAQAQAIDAHLTAHVRMMDRLSLSVREAMAEHEERLQAAEGEAAALRRELQDLRGRRPG